MESLFIIGLVAAVLVLMRRLTLAELRIAALEQWQAQLGDSWQDASSPELAEGEDPSASTVQPSVALIRSDEKIIEHAVEPIAPEKGASDEPEPIASQDEPIRRRTRLDLEDMLGRRLPIWAGGVTLAVAGVFLVRYSIERGLITPLLRVVMAFVFGFGLLASAEAAYRYRERVADPRVGQALAGAGLATLYAAFYLAGTQYGLIGQTLAFLGLAAVTAGAIALSFRFGLPSAVLGLVGGFAAPALVGGEEANLPLLSLYLGLVTTGLVVSGRRQQRPWLGLTALIGGLGWGALLLLSGDFGMTEIVSLGLYVVVLGAVLPSLAGVPQIERPLRLGAALVASLQLALLVDQAGYSPLVWGLYFLLGATLAFLAWRRPDIREGSAIAAVVALILLANWDGATGPLFAAVAVGIAAIFALVPLALTWRSEDRDADGWQLAGTATALATVAYLRFGDPAGDHAEIVLALAIAALAAIPGLAAWFTRSRKNVRMFTLHVAISAALTFATLLMVSPGWAAPLAGAVVFGGLMVVLRGRDERALDPVPWGAAMIVVLSLLPTAGFDHEVKRLLGLSQDTADGLRLLRWLAPATVFGALAWREQRPSARPIAEGVAVLFLYGALAQVLPRDVLAWTAALLAIALHRGLREREAAALVAVAIAAAWALEPLGWWLGAGLSSLAAEPVFVTALPDMRALGTRLVPVLAALAAVRVPLPDRIRARLPIATLSLPIALVVAHILFKQIFAIDGDWRFVALGLAERTVWEAVLLGAAWLAASGLPRLGPQRSLSFALAATALAHFALYTGLLHNPLWARQAMGSTAIANLGLVAYAVAIGAAVSVRGWGTARFAPAADGVVMVLASLAVLTLLRQGFAGSLPAPIPMTQTEDLLRSFAGILLALAFLWLGSARNERSWRLGSLAIMLVAVAKVFLVDAAGLDGLLRVASFMALGFSLIGIGWVYTRHLRSIPKA